MPSFLDDFFGGVNETFISGLERSANERSKLNLVEGTAAINEGYRRRADKEKAAGYRTALDQLGPGDPGDFGEEDTTGLPSYEGIFDSDVLEAIFSGIMDKEKFQAKEQYKATQKGDEFEVQVDQIMEGRPNLTRAEAVAIASEPGLIPHILDTPTSAEKIKDIELKKVQRHKKLGGAVSKVDPSFYTRPTKGDRFGSATQESVMESAAPFIEGEQEYHIDAQGRAVAGPAPPPSQDAAKQDPLEKVMEYIRGLLGGPGAQEGAPQGQAQGAGTQNWTIRKKGSTQ